MTSDQFFDRALNATQPNRRQVVAGIAGVTAALAGSGLGPATAQTPKPIRVAIAFGDIPRLWAGPDGGFQGMRVAGYPIYDALINWDLESGDRASGLVPGLAESWKVDPNDKSRWIVNLRSGVKFHDGSPFDADAALWNFASVFDEKAPQYNAPRVALIRFRLPFVTGAEKIDDRTIAIRTTGPDAMAPFQLSFLLFVSPTQYAKVGNDWDKFSAAPSGTGPFKVASLVPRNRLELVRNESYWDAKRIPKTAAITLVPILDPNARIAALRSGQVDMAEGVPSDAIASLKSAGLAVHTNIYPAILKWNFSYAPGSPFLDQRVRRAANLAIDREGLVKLLDGAAVAAKGFVDDSSPWFSEGSFKLKFDPAEAKKLLAEAGFGPGNRPKAKILIPSTGTGQMSLATNELVQANLAAVGIDIEFQVVDFVTMLTVARGGAKAPASAGLHGMAIPGPTLDPVSFYLRGFDSQLTPPRGSNWGFYSNPAVDDALHVAQQAFDPAELDKAMGKVNQLMVDDAASLLLAHDLNPWAMSSKVKNFVQPRNWFINLTSMSMD